MIESFSQLALSNTIPVFRLELNDYGLPRFSFEQAEKSPNLGFLSNSFRPSHWDCPFQYLISFQMESDISVNKRSNALDQDAN
jgi:hypothetical protein